jgi:hypothetical protein
MMMNNIVQHDGTSVNRFIKIPIDNFPSTAYRASQRRSRMTQQHVQKVGWATPQDELGRDFADTDDTLRS